MKFKQHAAHAGTEYIAQIKAQIGKGEGPFPLGRGGVVRIQSIIGRRLDGLKQRCKEDDDRRVVADGQDCRKNIQRHRQAVEKDDDVFPGIPVRQLAPKQRQRQGDQPGGGNERRGHPVAEAQLGGEQEGEHGPDKGAHSRDDLAHKEHIDLPLQPGILGDQIFHFLFPFL